MALRASVLTALVLTFALTGAARADDVTDQIDAAKEAYKAGDFTLAKQALEVAAQLIEQQKAESLPGYLPAPIKGWKVAEIETEAQGPSTVFGGGVSAKRTYLKEDGTADVTIEIIGDSPLMTQFASIMMNPSLAGAAGKLKVIDKQRALLTSDGELKLLVANRFLINITGTADEDAKTAFAKAIDYEKLQTFQ